MVYFLLNTIRSYVIIIFLSGLKKEDNNDIDYLRNLKFSLIHGEEMRNKYFYRISEVKIVRQNL